MLELRNELITLVGWEMGEEFECPTQSEIDAVGLRIVRMAELLRRMGEMAQSN